MVSQSIGIISKWAAITAGFVAGLTILPVTVTYAAGAYGVYQLSKTSLSARQLGVIGAETGIVAGLTVGAGLGKWGVGKAMEKLPTELKR